MINYKKLAAQEKRVEELVKHYQVLEAWRPVVGYSRYLISNYGRVRRLAFVDARGHSCVERLLSGAQADLSMADDSGIRRYQPVARLVLLHFVGPSPSPDKVIARHLDDDRTNNFVDNLAWGDRCDNVHDAIRNGLHIKDGAYFKTKEYRAAARARMLGSTMNRGRKHIGIALINIQTAARARRGKLDNEQTKLRKSESAKRAWARRKLELEIV